MKDTLRTVRFSFAVFTVAVMATALPAQQAPSAVRHTFDVTVVKPESTGFSAERLERLLKGLHDGNDPFDFFRVDPLCNAKLSKIGHARSFVLLADC